MDIAVVRFPGSNCDEDVGHVLSHTLPGVRAIYVFHKEAALPACDAVVLPGGYSFGDYLRAGAMAAHAPVMGDVKRFALAGGPVLGICNGFQILCEAGLLDGALTRNASLHFECRDVHVRCEGRLTPFTADLGGRVLRMPIAHAEGRYVHPEIERLEAEQRVVFRYVDASGAANPGGNPNGSQHNIAGIANLAGNIVGLMPHPERAAEAVLGSTDGRLLFTSLVTAAGGKPHRS